MKFLISGASSFTGYWISLYAMNYGYTVFAMFTKRYDEYTGIYKKRIDSLIKFGCIPLWECVFGSNKMLSLLAQKEMRHATLGIHGAYTIDYKNEELFQLDCAILSGIFNLEKITDIAKKNNQSIIYTGSAFEGGIFPPSGKYGLSKLLTGNAIRELCNFKGISFVHFIVANPFGPFQQGRFFNHVFNSLKNGYAPDIQDPWTIQDNILVESLSKIYIDVLNTEPSKRRKVICPSQYLESNLQFCCRLIAKTNTQHLLSQILDAALLNKPSESTKINAWLNFDDIVFAPPLEEEWQNFLSENNGIFR